MLIHYAMLEEIAGRGADARRRIDEALALLASLDHPEGLAEAHLIRGRLRQAAGNADAARDDVKRARALAADIDHPGIALRAACRLAGGDGGRAEDAEATSREMAPRASVCARTEGHWLLWCATKDPSHLEAARALVVHLCDHAPEDLRGSLVERVPLHRAIMEAAGRPG